MFKDPIGDRMKGYYEDRSKTYLTRRVPVIIRLDGVAFHTFTRGFKKPFDELLIKTMQSTLKYLCENIPGCVFGYTQSDEISLALIDYQKLDSGAWYEYSVQKITSVSASMATYAFNKYFNEYYLDLIASKGEIDGFDLVYDRARRKGAIFDSRAFNVPKSDVANYFYWRQLDAERNSVLSLSQSLYSHSELQGLNCPTLLKKMEHEKNVRWKDLEVERQRGSCCIKVENGYGSKRIEYQRNGETVVKEIDLSHVKSWRIDRCCPRFVDNSREYIERFIYVGEDDE